jgi:hypothetical protein
LGRGPIERDAGLCTFLQGGAKGGDGFGQMLGAGLALAEAIQRNAEIVLGPCPVEGDAGLSVFLQGGAKGGDGFGQMLGAGLARTEGR